MQDIPCNLCGRSDARILYPATITSQESANQWTPYRCTNPGYGAHLTIVKCRHCGLVYVNPRTDSQYILDQYSAVEDPLYIKERAGRVLTFEHHLIPLHRFTGPPAGRKLLDVGCYTGVFVEIAKKAGWDAYGLDPSIWAVGVARSSGLQVKQGTLDSADYPPQYFDVITMWDVIEHLDDPAFNLIQAYEYLKPGGLLVIHTMDISSLFARVLGHRWPWYMEMHLYYFSRRTLRSLVEKAGYKVLKITPQGRYLRMDYLASRLEALFPVLAKPVKWLVAALHLNKLVVPINLGDLVTLYAQKE